MSPVFVLLVLSIVLPNVKPEVYTAIADIESLKDTHRHVIKSLENYLDQETKRINLLKKYLDDYKSNQRKLNEVPGWIGNPLNTFRVLKSLSVDVNSIKNITSDNIEFQINPNLTFPNEDDIAGAATALQRVLDVYKLNIKELADGILRGNYSHGNIPYVEYTTPLTANECFVIGAIIFTSKEYHSAIDWFHEALKKYENFERHEDEYTPFREDITLDYIRKCYHELDDYKNAYKWTREMITLYPEKSTMETTANMVEYEMRMNGVIGDGANAPKKELPFIKKSYQALCRNEYKLSDNVTKSLKCYYKSGPKPFLKLAPVKTEQLYQEPDVFLFHDVISDNEIQLLQKLAKPKLARAGVVERSSGKSVPANYRISKIAWLKDETHETVLKISRRIADFTDLAVLANADELQVGNYGLGGHYDPHFDFFQVNTTKVLQRGNRIATVMFYMSDVEQGGATVFLDPLLTVFPVKNSAIYWLNLLPSGAFDMRTLHAACPVLRGSKWVSNKWIHQFGQELLRPCPVP